jgi:hydrogenase-4 component H
MEVKSAMFRSKIKEALICLEAGRVTLSYPFAPAFVPKGFRGLPSVDVTRCIGCGGCASVCPSSLVDIVDEPDRTTITRYFERCIYCGRCADVCPEKAIEMSENFETATNDIKDLRVVHHIYMATCSRCGRCFSSQTPLDPPDYRSFKRTRLNRLGVEST